MSICKCELPAALFVFMCGSLRDPWRTGDNWDNCLWGTQIPLHTVVNVMLRSYGEKMQTFHTIPCRHNYYVCYYDIEASETTHLNIPTITHKERKQITYFKYFKKQNINPWPVRSQKYLVLKVLISIVGSHLQSHHCRKLTAVFRHTSLSLRCISPRFRLMRNKVGRQSMHSICMACTAPG